MPRQPSTSHPGLTARRARRAGQEKEAASSAIQRKGQRLPGIWRLWRLCIGGASLERLGYGTGLARACARYLLALTMLGFSAQGGEARGWRPHHGGGAPDLTNHVLVYVWSEGMGETVYCDGIQAKSAVVPNLFGSTIGQLVRAEPPSACTHLANVSNDDNDSFALISRGGGCNTTVKALNAQAAGYATAIIFDDRIEDLSALWQDLGSSPILIPVVFISEQSAYNVMRVMKHDQPTECSLSDTWEPLRKVVLVIFAWLFMQFIINVWSALLPHGGETSTPQRMSYAPLLTWNPNLLPEVTFPEEGGMKDLAETDEIRAAVVDDNRTCTICLEEYEPGEKLRLMPCHHGFHTECIDPWLRQGQLLCPTCKQPADQGMPDLRRTPPWSPLSPRSPRSNSSHGALFADDPFAHKSPPPNLPRLAPIPSGDVLADSDSPPSFPEPSEHADPPPAVPSLQRGNPRLVNRPVLAPPDGDEDAAPTDYPQPSQADATWRPGWTSPVSDESIQVADPPPLRPLRILRPSISLGSVARQASRTSAAPGTGSRR